MQANAVKDTKKKKKHFNIYINIWAIELLSYGENVMLLHIWFCNNRKKSTGDVISVVKCTSTSVHWTVNFDYYSVGWFHIGWTYI